jgi:hypothetical protein
MEDRMSRIGFCMVLAASLGAAAPAFAKQAFEGTWAARRAFCGADLTRAVNNTDFPLIVTEDRVDWALNRCTILKRSGRNGIWQVRSQCRNNAGVETAGDFRLRVRGDRLTVTFADGARATYYRCK